MDDGFREEQISEALHEMIGMHMMPSLSPVDPAIPRRSHCGLQTAFFKSSAASKAILTQSRTISVTFLKSHHNLPQRCQTLPTPLTPKTPSATMMPSIKRQASDSFSKPQALVKRQKSNSDLRDGKAVALAGKDSDGALISSVRAGWALIYMMCSNNLQALRTSGLTAPIMELTGTVEPEMVNFKTHLLISGRSLRRDLCNAFRPDRTAYCFWLHGPFHMYVVPCSLMSDS